MTQTDASPRPSRLPSQRPGAAGGKRDQNRRERTRALCDAALGLFLERGIDSVAVDDITAAASVAKGSFYRYFDDKEALLVAVLAPFAERMDAAIAVCEQALAAASSTAGVVTAYLTLAVSLEGTISAHPREVLLYLQERRAPPIAARRPVSAIAARVNERAIVLTGYAHERGLLRPVEARVSALTVIGAVEQLAFEHLRGTDLGNTRAVAATVVSVVLEGLTPRR